MKKNILLVALFLAGTLCFGATTTITNSGTTFTPNEIVINQGDDVFFSLGAIHNAVEVSLATYNANGNTALPGGFSAPFGGGSISSAMLTAGVHYYVCTPHASLGMKGKITVLSTTGISNNKSKEGVTVFPNPSNGNFELRINTIQPTDTYELEVYNMLGKSVYSKSDLLQQNAILLELSYLPKGPYIVKLNDGKDFYYKKIVIR